jgi:hypothetical protein
MTRQYLLTGLWLFVAFAPGLGCGDANRTIPAQPPAAEPVKPGLVALKDDQSLTSEELARLGMPAHDRPWGPSEVEQAAKVLKAVAQDSPAKLPRYRSSRSGLVFASMTSDENCQYLRNDSLTTDAKAEMVQTHFFALNSIIKSYLARDLAGKSSCEEAFEIAGCMLRLLPQFHSILERYFASLDPNDPTNRERKTGFAKAPTTYAGIVNGALTMFSDSETCPEGSRSRLLGYLEQSLPAIYPLLPAPSQMNVTVRLAELEANPNHLFAKDRLRALREKLSVK